MIAETPTSHQHWIHDQMFNVSADAAGSISLEQFVTFLPLVLSSMKIGSLANETINDYVADLFRLVSVGVDKKFLQILFLLASCSKTIRVVSPLVAYLYLSAG